MILLQSGQVEMMKLLNLIKKYNKGYSAGEIKDTMDKLYNALKPHLICSLADVKKVVLIKAHIA